LGIISSLIILFFSVQSVQAHSFLWPLPSAENLTHPHFGANFPQAQWMGAHYFHAGLDLIADHGTPVQATVSGFIEAGYYSYEDRPHGHYYLNKTFIPLRETLSSNHGKDIHPFRFEVAIIDNDGFRHEYHHIDPSSLSVELRGKILRRGRVQKGETIGNVMGISEIEPGRTYDHIHYNVVSPSGIHLNPMLFTPAVPDQSPPTIQNVYYSLNKKCQTGIGDLFGSTQELVPGGTDLILIKASDRIEGNPFSLGLHKFSVTYSRAPLNSFSYDFIQDLFLIDELIDYRKVYHKRFCLEAGMDRPIQIQGSTNREFYYRVPVPEGYAGEIEVSVEDFVGNRAEKTLTIH